MSIVGGGGGGAKEESSRGLVVSAKVGDYAYTSAKQSFRRSCNYVCGTDYKPNPEILNLRRQLADLDQKVSRYAKKVSDLGHKQHEAEKEVQEEKREVAEKQAKQQESQREYDQCMGRTDESTSFRCSSEESKVASMLSRLESAQRDLDRAQDDLQDILDDIQSEQESAAKARQGRDQKHQTLTKTPEKIEVDKICAHNYDAQQHTVGASVTVNLTLSRIEDGSSVLKQEPFRYASSAKDVTFRAQRGRCSEVANGDPLQLPSEKALNDLVVKQVLADLRAKVLSSDASYRSGFLSSARRNETAGLAEEATESYVRYILTGPNKLESKKQITRFFKKSIGLEQIDGLWTL